VGAHIYELDFIILLARYYCFGNISVGMDLYEVMAGFAHLVGLFYVLLEFATLLDHGKFKHKLLCFHASFSYP
jgi:hypothetical protein